ncbi:hypothetical protein DHEL01_v209719 [Diaporthe helianthi]|uniref:Peptidase metallopeptidase domain-containing protein n=1 Tax=Diaporthe helianthi TaxID=158607 RepID=A0A2P5HNS9_DIAHE|nr:hypothetical protein DHEL01_v209719 [Diaporthe helianthi]
MNRMQETAVHPGKLPNLEIRLLKWPSNIILNLQPQNFGDVDCSSGRKSAIFGNRMSNIAPFIHSDGQLFDNGKDINITPSLTQIGPCMGPILDKLKQGDEAAHNHHKLGASRGTLGFDTKETAHERPIMGVVLSAERQARMNLTNGEIHRLIPCDRIIRFNVDTQSFLGAKLSKQALDWLIHDAKEVAKVFTQQKLGITFLHTTVPGREVFNIRYTNELPENTLANSFFPSDSSRDRRVLISPNAMYLAYRSGHSNKMRRIMRVILAHEFTHILGFRHWHAGSDPVERRSPSMLWPGTIDDNWDSIMCTPFHSRMDFSEEDVRTIREVYSAENGDTIDGCLIVDVDPHATRFLS